MLHTTLANNITSAVTSLHLCLRPASQSGESREKDQRQKRETAKPAALWQQTQETT